MLTAISSAYPIIFTIIWQSSLFIAAGLVASYLCKRHPARAHQVLLLSMIAAVAVPFMTIAVKHLDLGIFMANPEPAVEYFAASEVGVQPYDDLLTDSIQSVPIILEEHFVPSVADESEKIELRLIKILLVSWTAASVIFLVRLILTFIMGIRLVKKAQAFDYPMFAESIKAVSSKLGIKETVAVYSSKSVSSPVIWCWKRNPILLFPSGKRILAEKMDLVGILCHELAHLKRRDHVAGLLSELMVVFLPWHPLLWWAKKRLSNLSEQACDDWVMTAGGSGTNYAESLLDFLPAKQMAFVPAVVRNKNVLKGRVIRMLKETYGNPRLSKKWILSTILITAFIALSVAFSQTRSANSEENPSPEYALSGIEGTWQGTLKAQQDLRTVLKITRTDAGGIKATLYSIDQGGTPISSSSASFEDGVLKYAIEMIDGSYEGNMSADNNTITGVWTQHGGSLPLVLERATPATEWALPGAPQAMPANADPSFEGATIAASNPNEPGKAFLVQGTRFRTLNTTALELLTFTFGVQAKQLENAPPWLESEKYNIEAKLDTSGAPNDAQVKKMLEKLLADRLKLKFHEEQREVMAYVLEVAEDGPKLDKSDAGPNSLPGLFFSGPGVLNVQNANMTDFSHLMQEAVLDRPVVDRTGLEGRWNFTLEWTLDEAQSAKFADMGPMMQPASDAADAPPPLFTAVQQQIGLKFSSKKAQVPVIVIDHIQKPAVDATAPAVGAQATAQDPNAPAYRNVSIQLASAGPGGGGSILFNPGIGGLTIRGQTLRFVIAEAYGVNKVQVVGRDWDNEPRYNITAEGLKASESTSGSEFTSGSTFAPPSEMYGASLRELLAEEFGLVTSTEKGQLDGYALVVGDGEPKLTASGAGMGNHLFGMTPEGFRVTSLPLSEVAKFLTNFLGGIVVDQTGLEGDFDFEVKLTMSPGSPPDPAAISKALEEQVGLKIETRKLDVDMVNIVNLKPPEEVVTADQAESAPHPGTEAALRRHLEGVVKNQPVTEEMAPGLVAAIEQQWPQQERFFQSCGALESITFTGNENGNDVYHVEFENQAFTWTIGPLIDGKITTLFFRSEVNRDGNGPGPGPMDAARRVPAGNFAGDNAYGNVSIELASAEQGERGTILFNPAGGLQIRGQTLRFVIAEAYGVNEAQVVGRDWDNEPHYNITADGLKASGPTSASASAPPSEMFGASLRELLADKFGLVTSSEQRQLDGYALLVGDGEPNLKASPANAMGHFFRMTPEGINVTSLPLSEVTKFLSSLLGGLVVDQTGLEGNFDFEVKLPMPANAPPDPSAIRKALEEQVGLKIEARKLNMDVVNVINLKPAAEVVTDSPSATVKDDIPGYARDDDSGVGLEVMIKEQGIKIAGILPNSPASKAELSEGLYIQKIDGIPTKDKSLWECIEMIRGEAGSKVKLELADLESDKVFTVDMTREIIDKF